MQNIPHTAEKYREWWSHNTDAPYGHCWCGCGNKTRVAAKHNKHCGDVKGEPRKFIRNHHLSSGVLSRLPNPPYKIVPGMLDTPCWEWVGARAQHGHGVCGTKDGNTHAHVLFFERKYGPVPEGKELDHLCRNPPCVNPDHLEPVEHKENVRRGGAAKIDHEIAKQLRNLFDTGLYRQCDLADMFNLSRMIVHKAVRRKTWV